MKIAIYQINADRDGHNVMFINHANLVKFQGTQDIESSIYDKVFEGEVASKNLEQVYEMFNLNHPDGYRGRSLSVSDVVEIVDAENGKSTFHFCDSFGFAEVDFHPDECRTMEQATEKIRVLLVEPGKYPRMIEMDDTLEAMQKTVGGDIEEYMPFEDEVAIVCNEEGKMTGLELNRAIYSEPETVEMTCPELTERFRQAERNHNSIVGYIVFAAESFSKPYSEEQRTYVVSSNNKAFIDGMGGYSIYGSSLDGVDKCVRLESYMAAEHGGKDGWKIERCYIKDDSHREMLDIIAGKFFVCYAPFDSEKFQSLPDTLAKKYEKLFKNPERFFKQGSDIVAVPYKPASKEQAR